MIISFQSPRGGRKLNWLGWGERKPETIVFHDRETGAPVIMPDSAYCLVIGYSVTDLKKGERMYMKYTEAKELYKMLEDEFRK